MKNLDFQSTQMVSGGSLPLTWTGFGSSSLDVDKALELIDWQAVQYGYYAGIVSGLAVAGSVYFCASMAQGIISAIRGR